MLCAEKDRLSLRPIPEIELLRTSQSAALSALDLFLNHSWSLSAQAAVFLRLRRAYIPRSALTSRHSRLNPSLDF